MPKFLGMEPKTLLWVGGGLAALIVVYFVIKSRGGAAEGAVGGETGIGGGGIGGSSPVSYAPGAPDSAGDAYQKQLNDLDIQSRKEALDQQRGMYELQQETNKQQLGLWGAQQGLLFAGAQKEQEFQLGYEQEAFRTAQAAQEVVTRSVKGKTKVECPKGQHLAIGADGTARCQDLGGGGFNFSTITKGIADIATGLLGGAAAAAPGIGYGAANAWAAGAGLPQQKPSYGTGQNSNAVPYGNYTPPFSPKGLTGPGGYTDQSQSNTPKTPYPNRPNGKGYDMYANQARNNVL